MYKEASRVGLRVLSSRGALTVEQLWTLPLNELDALAVSLQEEYKESGKKSFLAKKSVKDKEAKLKFDVVLDILTTKAEEAEVAKNAASVKAHNEAILARISKKEESKLDGLSVEELTALLK